MNTQTPKFGALVLITTMALTGLQPPAEVNTMTTRQDLFTHTVNQTRFGVCQSELSDQLDECIQAAIETGKKATLTLKLHIKAVGKGGQIEIKDDISKTIPKLDTGTTLLFRDEDGNVSRDNPAQQKLNVTSVPDTRAPIKNIS